MTHPRAVQKFGGLGPDRAAVIKRCRNGRLQTISNGFQPLLAIDHFDDDVARHDTSETIGTLLTLWILQFTDKSIAQYPFHKEQSNCLSYLASNGRLPVSGEKQWAA